MRQLEAFDGEVADGLLVARSRTSQRPVLFSLPLSSITAAQIHPVPHASLEGCWSFISSCCTAPPLYALEMEMDAPDNWLRGGKTSEGGCLKARLLVWDGDDWLAALGFL